MKVIKTANGKTILKLNHEDWLKIGEQFKEAQMFPSMFPGLDIKRPNVPEIPDISRPTDKVEFGKGPSSTAPPPVDEEVTETIETPEIPKEEGGTDPSWAVIEKLGLPADDPFLTHLKQNESLRSSVTSFLGKLVRNTQGQDLERLDMLLNRLKGLFGTEVDESLQGISPERLGNLQPNEEMMYNKMQSVISDSLEGGPLSDLLADSTRRVDVFRLLKALVRTNRSAQQIIESVRPLYEGHKSSSLKVIKKANGKFAVQLNKANWLKIGQDNGWLGSSQGEKPPFGKWVDVLKTLKDQAKETTMRSSPPSILDKKDEVQKAPLASPHRPGPTAQTPTELKQEDFIEHASREPVRSFMRQLLGNDLTESIIKNPASLLDVVQLVRAMEGLYRGHRGQFLEFFNNVAKAFPEEEAKAQTPTQLAKWDTVELEAKQEIIRAIRYFIAEVGGANELAESMLSNHRVLLDVVEILRAFFAAKHTEKDKPRNAILADRRQKIILLLERLKTYLPEEESVAETTVTAPVV